MAQFQEYKDEIRDFSLLVNNQFLLDMVMKDIPIVNYKVEVMTENIVDKFGMAAFSEITFLVLASIPFKLELRVLEDEGDDFKFHATLKYPDKFVVPEGTISEEDAKSFIEDKSEAKLLTIGANAPEVSISKEEKTFFFRPTMQQGEVIVNELSIWLKEQIALKVSGQN